MCLAGTRRNRKKAISLPPATFKETNLRSPTKQVSDIKAKDHRQEHPKPILKKNNNESSTEHPKRQSAKQASVSFNLDGLSILSVAAESKVAENIVDECLKLFNTACVTNLPFFSSVRPSDISCKAAE